MKDEMCVYANPALVCKSDVYWCPLEDFRRTGIDRGDGTKSKTTGAPSCPAVAKVKLGCSPRLRMAEKKSHVPFAKIVNTLSTYCSVCFMSCHA